MATQAPPGQSPASTPHSGASASDMSDLAPAGSVTAHHHHNIAVALVLAAACVTGLAACGSSTSATPIATTGATRSQLSASRCMRAHGVPNFPDPGPNGGFQTILSSSGAMKIDGVTFSSPAFEAAEKTCMPGGRSGANPSVPRQQKQALLGFARCMRQHGISRYTDPRFPPGGGIFGGGVSPQAATTPPYKRAAALCDNTLGSYRPS
jgi:hypothetical protein